MTGRLADLLEGNLPVVVRVELLDRRTYVLRAEI